MPVAALLSDARKARLADDYATAIRLASAYLAASPGDPEAESFLGLCHLESGHLDKARASIEAAASKAPKSALVKLDLSRLREAEGDIRNAVVEASAAANLAPGAFEAWAQLGKLLGKAEKFTEAAAALKQACALKPAHAGLAELYAASCVQVDDPAAARLAIDAFERLSPGAKALLPMKSYLARRSGDLAAATDAARAWLADDPDNAEARAALAHAVSQQGYYDEASAVFLPLVSGKSATADNLAAFGRLRLGARDLDGSARAFKGALAKDADCAEAAFGLARRATYTGDLQEAERWCRYALDRDPRHADAYAQLTELLSGRLDEPLFAALAAQAASDDLAPEAYSALNYALGDALHRRKDTDGAFAAWRRANDRKEERALAEGWRYDPDAHATTIRELIDRFAEDPDPAPASDEARSGPQPIFIVGMPRSGTTLLESAIAAHPDVAPAGEVPAMPFLLTEFAAFAEETKASGDEIPLDKARAWRRMYLDQAAKFGGNGKPRFTDKQPANHLSVGLIRALFPEAPIIHIRRNPIETGLSIYRRNFTRQWPFANSLTSIGHCYGEYARLMTHWEKIAPPRRLAFVQYEDLVADFESEVRRLVAFCGLSWNDACLNFHESERSVMTFSAVQVRQPASVAHLGTAEPYRAHLAPLEDALVAAGVDIATGAYVGRIIH